MGLEPRGRADRGAAEANPAGEEPKTGPTSKVKSFEIPKRLVYRAWRGLPVSANESHGSSRIGTASRTPETGLWEPDDGRRSRPVLRAPWGETPRGDSPALAEKS